MPLGHWNWKWNQARSNYSTYDQELLAGMLVLSSQSRLLGSNPIVWLCDQEPVKSFQKGPPPGKAKLKRWWTYLSQFRLTFHHIPGIKNELSDYISRNNFDALIGESSEALAKEAFQRMDVSAASPICSDFQTFCPDWLHFGHFLCFGGIAASQLSHRIFPIYF